MEVCIKVRIKEYVLLFLLILEKNASENRRILIKIYDDNILAQHQMSICITINKDLKTDLLWEEESAVHFV